MKTRPRPFWLRFVTDPATGQTSGAADETPGTGPETPAEVPGSAPEVPVAGPKVPANARESDVNGPTGDDSGDPDQHQDLAAELAAAAAERDDLREQVQRLTVAAATGVPPELLTGRTPEELQASAAALVKFADERRRPVDFGGGRRGEPVQPPDADPIRSALGR